MTNRQNDRTRTKHLSECPKGPAFLVLILCLLVSASTSSAQEKKALTIAIDGLRPDALAVAATPNIDSLLDGSFFNSREPTGFFSMNAQAEHMTFSGPGWGAYITGLHVDRHGADSNSFVNATPGLKDWISIIEQHQPELNTYRVLTWAVADQAFESGADTAVNFEYTQVVGGLNGDARLTNYVEQLVQTEETDLVMTFFSDADSAGHSFGFDPTASGYLAEIRDIDRQIGRILDEIKRRPDFDSEDWLVVLTSDHGGSPDGSHSGGTPEKRAIPFIVASKSAPRTPPIANPRQVDVANTVLAHFGVPIPDDQDGNVAGLAANYPVISLGRNLIFNGDAEFDRGFNSNDVDQYASGWEDFGPGGINVIEYDSPGLFPSSTDPGPESRGRNLFVGGLGRGTEMTQTIDVSGLIGQIDQAIVEFQLSAWLGGFGDQRDNAALRARFLDEEGSLIGLSTLRPKSAAARNNETGLFFIEDFGDLPALTRTIEVQLSAASFGGENEGFADNMSLVLSVPEPSTWLLLSMGGIFMGLFAIRRR